MNPLLTEIITNINDHMTAQGDRIIDRDNHMKVHYKNYNIQFIEDAVKSECLLKKMESILFISDCLTNVRIAKFLNNHWDCGKLATWKLFEFKIHQDCNISVVVRSVGMENLRLIPAKS